MTEPKRNAVFVFYDGCLTIKLEGYGETNGWGTFSFEESQLDIIPHEEKPGASAEIDIPKSELIELRNFLNKWLPPPTAEIDAALTGQPVAGDGDREETATENPKSWVAWKRRSEALAKVLSDIAALKEVACEPVEKLLDEAIRNAEAALSAIRSRSDDTPASDGGKP